ncbi:uncharacterized protein ALTATR162_LOCUS3227 [Alternaria atra]|uniref:USP domain-containing protein n=1 Tax=Alternaria atra TaxID=119953 RepID=A0A8J2N404_9PLEO|nr:uncharacterized protein ALTATR162_LOCUS3227 [Alternaria atra]CAG5153557.1 unnamed protein product [Alternaria atra]
MVCAMKELIPRYWGDYRMNGQEPMPFEPDDTMLRQIYNYSAKNETFRPIEVMGINGKITLIDRQCDAEEWMTYFLGECREATDKEVVPDWEASYRALFEFEFEERRYCNTCDIDIPRNPDPAIDPPRSFKPPSLGFNGCSIDRNNPGTIVTAIDDQLADEVGLITKDCPACKSNRLVRKRFRIDAAPEYMLVKFNLVYNAAPPPSPPSTVPQPPDMCKITEASELPEIDEILDLTQHQVDPSTKLMYRLVAVLPHLGALDCGHWIATVRKYPRWYNINDGDVNQVKVNFALSNPEVVPENLSGTGEEREKKNNKFQMVVLMYARIP